MKAAAARRARSPRRCRPRRHHPPRPATHFNPCALYYISADNIDHLPRQIDGQKTPLLFWMTMVRIAQHSRTTACHGGVRYMAQKKVRCSVDTYIKYRNLGKSFGMIDTEDHPGIGAGREASLSWPIAPAAGKTNYWQLFGIRAESTFVAQCTTHFGNSTVKSKEAAVTSATVDGDAPQPNAVPSPEEKPEEKPSMKVKSSEDSAASMKAQWTTAILLAWIVKIIGFQLKEQEAKSILRTCERRGLTERFQPESVFRLVLKNLTDYEGYDRFGRDRIESPGGCIHAEVKRLDLDRIEKSPIFAKFASLFPPPRESPSTENKCNVVINRIEPPPLSTDSEFAETFAAAVTNATLERKPPAVCSQAELLARAERRRQRDLDAVLERKRTDALVDEFLRDPEGVSSRYESP